MNVAPAAIQKTKAGTCPHGLPYGACPICSGAGGGGGGVSSKKTPKVAGEMSWDQCYAVWQQMLKAKDAAQQKKLDAMNPQTQYQITFAGKLENFALKIATLIDKLSDLPQVTKNLPKLISKPISLATNFLVGVLNIVKEVSMLAQKAINVVQQKLTDISDKLSAIFGELKNSIEKTISDRLKDSKKKIKSFFGIFKPEEAYEENEKVEDSQKLFKLKTTLQTLKEKLFKNKEPKHDAEC